MAEYKSNFQKVQEFNRAFDMVESKPANYNTFYVDKLGRVKIDPLIHSRISIFEQKPETVRLRLALIKEEVDELEVAFKESNIKEQRDACGDILYVVYGMADVLGINIDDIFRQTIESDYLKYINDINDNNNNNNNNNNKNNNGYFEYIKKIGSLIDNDTGVITNFNYVKALKDIFETNKDKLSHEDQLFSILTSIKLVYEDLEENCFKNLKFIEQVRNDILLSKFEIIAHDLYKLLKYTYYYFILINFNADHDFAIIHDSNMSKLCSSEAEAKETVADYEAKFTTGKSPYDSPYYYYLPNLNKWIVKNKSTGKALKNINYIQVKFD